MKCPVCGGDCGPFICKDNVLARNDITVCCCANPVCLEKGCQIQANQTFPSVAVKYVPVTMPDAAAAERAAIVAWLRSMACVDWEPASLQIANAIEAGEHRWAEAEHEAYLLRVRLRQTAQILIDAIGADGPMDAEEAAKKLVLRFELLESLLKELVDLFGWSDNTPLHAVLHIRNAVSNMQVDTRLSERAAIVAWLRAKAEAWGTEGSMGYAADLIEAGEHRWP